VPNTQRVNKRKLGTEKEALAAEYLKQQGYFILERNYRNRFGEIDIIAVDGDYLCFVEIKYRSSREFGYPGAAVDSRKQRKIAQVANYYLMKSNIGLYVDCRFDVVSICGDEISLVKNAFFI